MNTDQYTLTKNEIKALLFFKADDGTLDALDHELRFPQEVSEGILSLVSKGYVEIVNAGVYELRIIQ